MVVQVERFKRLFQVHPLLQGLLARIHAEVGDGLLDDDSGGSAVAVLVTFNHSALVRGRCVIVVVTQHWLMGEDALGLEVAGGCLRGLFLLRLPPC